MRDVKAIAEDLTNLFLRNGNFAFANATQSTGVVGFTPARTDTALESLFDEKGFSGLSVQSVGYSQGEGGPKVHVYLTKGKGRDYSIEINGESLRVSTHRVGKVIINPEQAAGTTNQGKLFTRRSRIACGSSCAPTSERYSGTFGALVHKKGTPKSQLYILSNNHILAACNHIPIDMPIMSPSGLDGGSLLIAPREIGRHAEICILRSGAISFVDPCEEDVALAKVVDLNVVSSWQGPDANSGGYDTPTNIGTIDYDMKVKKVGRTTGLTRGTVEAKLTPFPLPYKSTHFSATVWFKDAWSIRGEPGQFFALPGDSGSLVVTDDDTSVAIGLVFATSPHGETAIIPMNHISQCFGGLSLVGEHGI